MKAFTVSGSVISGIKTEERWIVVGESGRGRKCVRVPLPNGAVVEADVLTHLPGPDGSALVLIRDHSGYRGGWSLHAPRTEAEWDVIAAHRVDGHDGYAVKCPSCAGRLNARKPASVKIVAKGYRAQGIAGAKGGGPEYLIVLKDGESIEIVRTGRLYGAPSVLRVDCRGGEVTVTNPSEEADSRLAARLLSFGE